VAQRVSRAVERVPPMREMRASRSGWRGARSGRGPGVRWRAIGSRVAPASAQKLSSCPSSRLRRAKLRRLRDLAFYMGCCPHRREGPVRCGTLPSPSVIRFPIQGLPAPPSQAGVCRGSSETPVRRPRRASAECRLRRPLVARSGERGAGSGERATARSFGVRGVHRWVRCPPVLPAGQREVSRCGFSASLYA
jgi:hypothetical protein